MWPFIESFGAGRSDSLQAFARHFLPVAILHCRNLVLQKRHERSIRRNWIVCRQLHRDKNNDEEFLVDITIGACEAFDQKGQDTRTVFGKRDRKSTRLNSSHITISYAVFCLKKKKK